MKTIGGYGRIDNLQNKSVEQLELLKEFLNDLTIDTLIDATNASIITSIYGAIPAHKQEMIRRLEKIYTTYGEKGLRKMRDSLGAI